jgi:aromatic ring-opening dioxygenase catalytic subunit (LigB family)
MAEVVWAAGISHTAGMLRDPGGGGDGDRAKRVYDGFAKLAASLAAARPDVLVVIATDHFLTFPYETMPAFALGRGDRFESWGEFGAPKLAVPGNAAFGDEIYRRLVAAEFDVTGAAEMRLDHSFSCPLKFLTPDCATPVLPIFVNCNVAPLPTLKRALAFGRALGEAIRTQGAAERVAVVGTGGLSHWIGLPRTGEINTAFDENFLAAFEKGQVDAIAGWDSDRVIRDAGNGAAEIRNWIIAAAAARPVGARRLAYEPVYAWKTGIALVELGVR